MTILDCNGKATFWQTGDLARFRSGIFSLRLIKKVGERKWDPKEIYMSPEQAGVIMILSAQYPEFFSGIEKFVWNFLINGLEYTSQIYLSDVELTVYLEKVNV